MQASPILEVSKNFFNTFTPPPDFTVSEWAEANRYLSSESSALPGKWHNANAPYQPGIMDAVSDTLVQSIIIMTSSQIGKTEIINNILGYFIEHDPCPILNMQPTLEMGHTWSKDRLMPMLRDTPCLRDKVKDTRAKDSNSTMLHKSFAGGHLTICGANSPASLASRPIRVLLCDEIDRYPLNVGGEGDPVALAEKRTSTFWNRKIVKTSTPTIKGVSRIEAEFEKSDKRKFFVSCPNCDEYQELIWGQVQWPDSEPEKAFYRCPHCGEEIHESEKMEMLRRGEWRATAPFNGIAGFHINEIYSPWVSFGEMATAFYRAKDLPETLKVWINTSLGQSWEERGDQIDQTGLMERREEYGPDIPSGAGILTAGVDVQDDRLEIEVIAWGLNLESWSLEYTTFHGDTTKPEIWQQLNDYLLKAWHYAAKPAIATRIAATCIDTGGHATQEAYSFCKSRYAQRVFAIKGSPVHGRPIFERPSKRNKGKVPLWSLGVDTIKDSLFSRLKISDPGPGYCHFPMERDPEYFDQLTAEQAVTRYNKGFPHREYVKIRKRNEALDCRVYGIAAYHMLNPNMDAVMARLQGAAPGGNLGAGAAHGRRVISRGVL